MLSSRPLVGVLYLRASYTNYVWLLEETDQSPLAQGEELYTFVVPKTVFLPCFEHFHLSLENNHLIS